MATDLTPSEPPRGPSPLPADATYPADSRAAAFPSGPAQDTGVPWGRYLDSIRRHKWLVLLVTVAGTALGFLATRFLTPQYTVQSTIWVSEGGDRGSGPIQAPQLLSSYAWIELLNSYAVLDAVVQEMALNVVPVDEDHAPLFAAISLGRQYRPGAYVVGVDSTGGQYVLQTAAGATIERGAVGDSIGRKLGLRWAPSAALLPAGEEVAFRITTPRDAANNLKARLTPSIQEDGRFLRLTLAGDNPERLMATMNVLTEQFVQVAAELKKAALTERAAILDRQLSYSERELKEAEVALEGFRVETITLPAEGGGVTAGLEITQDPVMSSFFQQKVQIEEVRRDRAALQNVLAGVRRGTASVDAFYGIPAVQTAPELQSALSELTTREAELRALSNRYTGELPEVQALQNAVNALRTQTIPGLTVALIRRLSAQEQQLGGQIQSASREIQEIPARTIEEARLRRGVQISDRLYNELKNRYEDARLAEVSATPDVRVLDEAVLPDAPTENNAPRILLMAFLASLGTGVAGAVLLGHHDKRFRYPEQVTQDLGLVILGAIPGLKSNAEDDPEQTSQMVEAFRSIRLNLSYAYGAAGPIVFAVSSPNSGDGKSFVASNLALSYADAGYRTLLIDGDIRQGDLHRTFQLERRPGLVDVLAGATHEREVVQPTRHANLSVITSGTRNRRAPELLGSNATAQLFASAKSQFDVIVVDTPPLSAGIDPFVLGTATGNMLLVLRSGETDRKLAEAKLQTLDHLPIRLLGAVLNDVSPTGAYRYYAYDYAFSGEELDGGGDSPQLVRSTS